MSQEAIVPMICSPSSSVERVSVGKQLDRGWDLLGRALWQMEWRVYWARERSWKVEQGMQHELGANFYRLKKGRKGKVNQKTDGGEIGRREDCYVG